MRWFYREFQPGAARTIFYIFLGLSDRAPVVIHFRQASTGARKKMCVLLVGTNGDNAEAAVQRSSAGAFTEAAHSIGPARSLFRRCRACSTRSIRRECNGTGKG